MFDIVVVGLIPVGLDRGMWSHNMSSIRIPDNNIINTAHTKAGLWFKYLSLGDPHFKWRFPESWGYRQITRSSSYSRIETHGDLGIDHFKETPSRVEHWETVKPPSILECQLLGIITTPFYGWTTRPQICCSLRFLTGMLPGSRYASEIFTRPGQMLSLLLHKPHEN